MTSSVLLFIQQVKINPVVGEHRQKVLLVGCQGNVSHDTTLWQVALPVRSLNLKWVSVMAVSHSNSLQVNPAREEPYRDIDHSEVGSLNSRLPSAKSVRSAGESGGKIPFIILVSTISHRHNCTKLWLNNNYAHCRLRQRYRQLFTGSNKQR